MIESNDGLSTWPSYCGDKIDVWVGQDRLKRVAFRVKDGHCVLEFSGPAFGNTIRIPFELAALRAVLMENAAFAKCGDATCVVGRWGKQIEVCMIGEVGVRCSIPLGRYIAVLGYLNHQLRLHAKRHRRTNMVKD